MTGACPCLHVTPCDPRCTCVDPLSSVGCSRCCSYGSKGQQIAMAKILVSREPKTERDAPRRWRSDLPIANPSGDGMRYLYGCYFPRTDLNVNDMGTRGTGRPVNVVWLDELEDQGGPLPPGELA